MSNLSTDSKTLVLGVLASDAFTMVNKRILRAFDGDGTLAIVLCELIGIYKYMVINHQVDPLGAFPLPAQFLQKTMNLSSFKQQRALSMLAGGNLLVVTKLGMPATRHVALNFDAIAKLILEEDPLSKAQASSTEFYERLSSMYADDDGFQEALDNIKDPLRGVMILLVRKLREEGVVAVTWKAQHIGQLKVIAAYYGKKNERFDYRMIEDLLTMTRGESLSGRIASMLKNYKQVIQRAPEERKYVY